MSEYGLYYPSYSSPTDQVVFKSLTNIEYSEDDGQNVGESEDYKSIVYSHSVATDSGYIIEINITAKMGDNWSTNYRPQDLRAFLRTTINFSEKAFELYHLQDGVFQSLKVRYVQNSFKITPIPGTKLHVISLKLKTSD